MLACVFSKIITWDSFFKGSGYFVIFLIIIFLIDKIMDYLNRK